jgi:hypothetical protein
VVTVEAARSVLGSTAERFRPFAADVQALRLADLDLAAAIADIRRGDRGASAALGAWLARSDGWAGVLEADAPRSYYDRATLAAAITRR